MGQFFHFFSSLFSAELKVELMRERELRESTEKQLALEQRDKIVLTKRLKKEKKARKRLQEQVEQLDPKAAAALQVNSSRESGSQDRDSDSDQMPVPHPPKPSSVDNLRMLNGKHSLSQITLNILSQNYKINENETGD